MKKILYSWVGVTDFKVFTGEIPPDGALLAIAKETKPDIIELLWGDDEKTPAEQADDYKAWLAKKLSSRDLKPEVKIHVIPDSTNRVMDFSWINHHVEELFSESDQDGDLVVNASSGTPMMTAVWIVRAKAKSSGHLELYFSSREKGVEKADLPQGLEISLQLGALGGKDKSHIEKLLSSIDYQPGHGFDKLIAKSIGMQTAIYKAESAAPFHGVPVLIKGPPGVGKSLLAEAIHLGSDRRDKEFREIDCGTLNDTGAISELWGWKRGAFTDAKEDNPGIIGEADGGTIFLDEIGNAPLEVQRSLLRLLQTKKVRRRGETKERDVDIRIIAATNLDLSKAVMNGSFRQDLLDRISGITIDIPPLSERPEDILPIAQRHLEEFNENYKDELARFGKIRTLGKDAERALKSHSWPGNIRELKHLIERLVIFGKERPPEIPGQEIKDETYSHKDTTDEILNQELSNGFSLEKTIKEVEFHYAERALQTTRGKVAPAADLLGIGRTKFITLQKKLKEFGYKL